MDKGSNEKPKQMDEEEGNVEQDQAKDTEDPANADTPEMREKTFVVETMHGNGPGVFLEESDLLQPIPEDRGDVLPSMSDGSNPEPKDDDDNPPSDGDEAVQAPEPWKVNRWGSLTIQRTQRIRKMMTRARMKMMDYAMLTLGKKIKIPSLMLQVNIVFY